MTLFSLIMSFLTLFTSIFVPLSRVPVPDSNGDFVPVMRFVATSDTHVIALGDTGCTRIAKMMNSVYEIAEKDEHYNKVDAAVFSGDLTDYGTFTGFSAFAATTDKAIRNGTERLAVVAQSHDGGEYGDKSLSMFTELTGQETDFHRVINGFHFIGISASAVEGEQYSEYQRQWLESELKAATEAAPEQPVFVFHHEHVLNTVFGSYTYDGWGIDYFKDIFNRYPQIVHISGHSHYPANDPRSIWQETFTAIGDGGLAYYEFTVDDETSVHPAKSKTMTQALVVEVDSDNRVLVRVLDVNAGEYVAEYLVDNVSSPLKFKYNHDYRRLNSEAPVFKEDDALTVKGILGYYTVTVPQASVTGDNEVYLYRISVTDEYGNLVYTAWELSQYYFADVPDSISFKNIKLPKGNLIVSVQAEDVWGNVSECLTAEISG